MAATKTESTPPVLKATSSGLMVDHVELHKAIRIGGKTEANINKTKVPAIKSMEWTHNGFLIIRTTGRTHVLPSAAVNDSLLVE